MTSDLWPSYLNLPLSDIERRRDKAIAALASCQVCPRDCKVDRTLARHEAPARGRQPVCRTWRKAWVSSHFPHFGEEDCLRGWRGSGTIFFSWCNLRCCFCQNGSTSQDGAGRAVDGEDLAAMMLELQEAGCHNINFVTPEHVVPQLLEGLVIAIDRGLRLPIVYNTSAYDSIESLKLMDGIVDIYMPDFKFWDTDAALNYTKSKDYRDVACEVLREMHRQVGDLVLDRRTGLALRGLLVRHLVMPNHVADAARIMRFLHDEISEKTYVNIMGQYRPEHRVADHVRYADINRHPTRAEVEAVHDAARLAGLYRFDACWAPGSALLDMLQQD